MKTLILALMIFGSVKSLAAQPLYGCTATYKDDQGNVMDLSFDQESGGIGEAYLLNLNPKAPLKGAVHKFKSISGNVSVEVLIKEVKGTAKIKKGRKTNVREFDSTLAVNLDGDLMKFRGTCFEVTKK